MNQKTHSFIIQVSRPTYLHHILFYTVGIGRKDFLKSRQDKTEKDMRKQCQKKNMRAAEKKLRLLLRLSELK